MKKKKADAGGEAAASAPAEAAAVRITDSSSLPKAQPSKSRESYVPKAESFVDSSELLDNLCFAISEDMPVLLVGETGTGKTSAIRHLASMTGNAFRRLNLNGQTTVDEFVGKIMINEKGTYWSDGILVDAMRHGHWLLLDEINAALPEVLMVLQSLLDDDRYVVLSDKPAKGDSEGRIIETASEIVRPHPDFRIFASMNPSDGYVGTKDLNKALMSRFPMVLEVRYPDEAKELEIVRARFAGNPSLPGDDELLSAVRFGNQLRQSHAKGEMDFVFSTRELLGWTRMRMRFGDWNRAAEVSFLNKCSADDRDAVSSILRINFKSPNVPFSELKAGDEIMFTSDVTIVNQKDTFIAKGTHASIVRVGNSNHGMAAKIKILSAPARHKSGSKGLAASAGEQWAVVESHAGGKFGVVRTYR